MNIRTLAALPVAAAIAVLAVPAAFADTTPVASIDITTTPGSFPVTSAVHWAAPDQEVLVSDRANTLRAQGGAGFDYIGVELRGPNGAPLQAGTYNTVGDPHSHPELASVLVISNGLGCYAEEGGFTVDRIEFDPSTSVLTAFDGSYDHRCAGSTGADHGEIHFQR
ncbi:hypothetical protein [Kutzneria buriramensis]|uniref:Uncharacterized protein n=1 Tax=Kutzneria buriramensis TaxID=1045776 RepID=A0A3E0GWK0_9PSEU|nr:hypothetical protein [Kutzneria buriramensis]REH32503.1 hypothetical protein BCF44_12151 [Kutzneria buriramensis]